MHWKMRSRTTLSASTADEDAPLNRLPGRESSCLGAEDQNDADPFLRRRIFTVSTRADLVEPFREETLRQLVAFGEFEFEHPMAPSDFHFHVAAAECVVHLDSWQERCADQKHLQAGAAGCFAADRILRTVNRRQSNERRSPDFRKTKSLRASGRRNPRCSRRAKVPMHRAEPWTEQLPGWDIPTESRRLPRVL